jgi:hypothetical protein
MASDRAWRRAADAVAALGHSVVVFDPEATIALEELYDDEHPEHGVITVLQAPHLLGWELHIREELLEVDEMTRDMLDTLEDVAEDDDPPN